ncbi:MAG: 6-carboxytetrahydropterin synthase [Gemmatimonadetes bacterium]|nr:6-carboxytetrahydropterin synthase [Gemmatimonadota bacterium]
MPRATLTRRLTFSAAHRYRRPEWSDAKNAEVFGACAHPNWHGHTYTCEVTVGGEIDPLTGFCADLAALDRVLAERVHARLDHKNLVLDVPEFAEGREIPTSENVAWWIAREVQAGLGGSARVLRVRLAEMSDLWVEIDPT